MLGDIDYFKKPYKPGYFLALPNKEIIGKLSEAYGDGLETPVNETYELNLNIPYWIDVNHVLLSNLHIDSVKENYLIKVSFGKTSEWYSIVSINEVMNDDSNYKQIKAYSLEFELAQRVLKGYKAESKGARTVLTEMLDDTTWAVGDVDPDFELSKRSFEFLDNKLLGSIYDVANTYNAIVNFDTENQTVGLRKVELFGQEKGLTFSYESLLKSFDKKSDANELITRLYLEGKDGLTINSISPTGKSYLEDYSYYMYPFSRDVDKKILQHSSYMSDSLCHAILDYQTLIEQNKDQFSSLKTAHDGYASTIATKQSELVDLQNQLKVIYTIVDNYQLDTSNRPTMFFENVDYQGSTKIVEVNSLQTMHSYAVMAKISNVNNIQVSLNGNIKTITSNKWTLLGKVKDLNSSSVLITGAGGTVINLQVTSINDIEYTAAYNDDAIIERYCPNHKQMQIDGIKEEIIVQFGFLDSVSTKITDLQMLLSSGNNFTSEQLIELQRFIKMGTYKNDNCINPEDLLKAGEENFADVKVPQMSMDIDVVYFLSVVEEQSKWDKLVLGDDISVKYERIGINVKAKIIKINYDFEGEKISLTLSNVRNDGTAATKLKEMLKKSTNSSTTIDANKADWLKSVTDVSDMSLLFEEFWDKVTNQINMSVNNTVQIDNRGITIIDPTNVERFLRATAGSIALTKSGGLRYELALTPDGLVAETIYGKIILSQRVVIGDANGIWLMEGPKTTVRDRQGRIAMLLGLIEENPDKFGILINRYATNDKNATIINKFIFDETNGFKIQQYNGHSYVDKFYVDPNGLLFAEDMTAKRLKILSDKDELLLDSYTKEMNIGKFINIITDGKLTAIEKLQVLGERTRIMSEYIKLLDQANAYKKTSRDDTVRIDIPPFTVAYNALIAYLEPLLSNMTETSAIDRDEFIQFFKLYYDQVVRIVQGINDSIKYSSIQLGSLYNGTIIDAENGVTVTRSDDLYRTRMNATDGISIEKNVNGVWVKKFYIDATTSRLMVEELIAKKLTIVNDLNDVFLDIDSSYLNIGRFTNIITDNKLTSIEKLTLLQEWQTIQTEYVKLLQQATQYKTSQRDNHQTVLIDIPPFTAAFNNLAVYVFPLLADMNATTDIDREVFKTNFQTYYDQAQRIINQITDAVKWSSLQLGQMYNKLVLDALNGITVTRSDDVVKVVLNATDGISVYRNGEKNFYVDTEGKLHAIDLIAKRLKITSNPFGTGGEDELLLDAEQKKLWLNRWDIEGIGKLTGEMLEVNTILAGDAYVNNLTVNRLNTTGKDVEVGQYIDYIDIQDNFIKFITAKVNVKNQAADSKGRLLYWQDANRKILTTDNTGIVAYQYNFSEIKIKWEMTFENSGDSATPRETIGTGDNFGYGRVVNLKRNGGYKSTYYQSNYGKERSMDFADDGISFKSENGSIISSSKDYTVTVDNGTLKIGDLSGGLFEITNGIVTIKGLKINFDAAEYNFK